jgi:hypothetical protein
MASAAQAARLSMAFGDGSNEVTMNPSDTVRVDIIWQMGAFDGGKVPQRLTGLDLRFNVDDLPEPGSETYGGQFPGSNKFTVTEVSTTQASWNLSATTGVGVPGGFSDGGFFLSGGDPAGTGGVVGTNTAPVTVLSFVIHMTDANFPGQTWISFRHLFAADPLPAAYNGPSNWSLRFNGYTVGAAGQFDIGQGNPSDNGPAWAPFQGYEPYLPLIIHKVPEPGTLALLALGGLVALRRRS